MVSLLSNRAEFVAELTVQPNVDRPRRMELGTSAMSRVQKRQGYLLAIVATALICGLRLALNPILAGHATLLPFVLSILPAAWWGGLGPGLLATALGAACGAVFFTEPYFSLWIESLPHGLNAFLFVLIGVTTSGLCEAVHAAHRRDRDRQFRTLADSISQLVWMARPDGYGFWFNERWYDFTGMQADEVVGWGWQAALDPIELPRVMASWQAALAQGLAWEETFRLRRRDGQLRSYLCRARPLRGEDGEVICWFGTHTDIEERLRSERALREADRRKDEFLATLAHELRNPLAPINNALTLWPRVASDPAEMSSLRDVIGRQVGHMTRLVDDLLDVARVTRGKIHLQQCPLDLSEVIAGAIETNRALIDLRRHTLVVNTPADEIDVFGDAMRLTQVFSNILNNAAKYTPPGGTITVTVRRHADEVVVAVRDTGPGLPESMLGEIFEMFRQVDRTLDSSAGGLGIGLTLVKQLVELHSGSVEARSEGSGLGSEFVVTLPALSPGERHALMLDLPHHRALTEATPKYRVLVVDDYPDSARTLATVLEAMGHEATAMEDGRQAADWVAAYQPDAVLLDIAMPGLDGYELAKRLRAGPAGNELVLIALTGYGQPQDRQRTAAGGFDAHLTKPVTMAALGEVLTQIPQLRSHCATLT